MNPKVSIIIPVYNAEKFLHQCMDSVINQTLEEIEIVAVNDCSSDNSVNILNEYKKNYPKKVIVIDSKKNRGPGGARNAGLDIARGEYIGFVDSDDYVKPEMFKKLYKIAKRADYDIIDSAFYRAKDNQKIISVHPEAYGELDDKKTGLMIVYTGYLWTKLIKRSIFSDNNIRFRENVSYEDIDLLHDVYIHSKKLGYTNEAFYTYRDNADSITNNLNLKPYMRNQIAFIYASRERLKKAGCAEKYNVEFTFILYKTYSHLLYLLMFSDDMASLEIFKYLKDFFFELQYDYKNNPYIKDLDRRYIKLAEINNESPEKALKCRDDILNSKF